MSADAFIDGLNPYEGVFVFGSNLAGRHGAGAAKTARVVYGATPGIGEGERGNSYAIPTKDEGLKVRLVQSVRDSVNRFIEHAAQHPNRQYYVTRVGCGLAGFTDFLMAPMFESAGENVHLPGRFELLLNRVQHRRVAIVANGIRDHEGLLGRVMRIDLKPSDVVHVLADDEEQALVLREAIESGFKVIPHKENREFFTRRFGRIHVETSRASVHAKNWMYWRSTHVILVHGPSADEKWAEPEFLKRNRIRHGVWFLSL